MKTILETERLLLREFLEQDAEAMLAFNGDPRVMWHTGEPVWGGLEETRRRIRDYPDYRRHGYGRWAVVYKQTGAVVGFNGLKYLEELNEVDLGFRLAFDWWGRGIATESSLAVVRYGFEILGLEQIIGLVVADNPASIRVLQKVGMRRAGTVRYFGERVQRWLLTVGDCHGPPKSRPTNR